ncbi:MAG: NAD(P)/FAD-dependent oxidoreductase, partial [Bacteroidetes bacterium]|nr:NAD(P)/FAD-dependent oxidoreductase [Bacteroidota bacterium]
LPIITKYFFSDGSIVNAYANLEQFKQELHEQLRESKEVLDRFFQYIEKVYNFVSPIFLQHPIKKFYKYLPLSLLKSIRMSLQIGAFQTLAKSNATWFRNPKTQMLFNRFATYNGSNPYKAPATLNVIPHLEHRLGAYFVEGGMRAVATAIYNLALDLGVEFQFNSKVDEILLEGKITKGVRIGKQLFMANQVFCNMDVNLAYPNLLKQVVPPQIYLKQEKSSSALVFYWAMDRSFDLLDVHNLVFSANYKEEFECLSEAKVYHDPSIYIYISSKVEEKDAPLNKENWFVMINAPNDTGQNWEEIKREAKANILQRLNNLLHCNVSDYILEETYLGPKEIALHTNSYAGALYGNSSNNRFAAFLRHPHQNGGLKNLSFVGGSTHPGGGIPLCLLSAKIAVNEMDLE